MNIPVHVVLDVCALCTGFAGVWLTAKQHIGCWPAGIVSVCIQGFRFFQSELYADAALQMLFVVMGVYGWIYWKAPNKKIKIKWPLVFSNFMYVCIAAMLFWILLYKVLIFLNGARPILDSGLTVLSLVATGYTILDYCTPPIYDYCQKYKLRVYRTRTLVPTLMRFGKDIHGWIIVI